MTNTLDIARQFSAGKFEQVADQLSEEVTFHIYEDKKHLTGKTEVLEFCKGIADYLASVDTDFQESGNLVSDEKVAIYGYGELEKTESWSMRCIPAMSTNLTGKERSKRSTPTATPGKTRFPLVYNPINQLQWNKEWKILR